MDKVKLVGGECHGISIQAEITGSRMYVDGWLYVWDKTVDRLGYRVFKWSPIVPLRDSQPGWEDDGGR